MSGTVVYLDAAGTRRTLPAPDTRGARHLRLLDEAGRLLVSLEAECEQLRFSTSERANRVRRVRDLAWARLRRRVESAAGELVRAREEAA